MKRVFTALQDLIIEFASPHPSKEMAREFEKMKIVNRSYNRVAVPTSRGRKAWVIVTCPYCGNVRGWHSEPVTSVGFNVDVDSKCCPTMQTRH